MSPLLQVLSHVVWGQHLHRAETCLLDCLDRPFSRHLSPWPSAGVSLSFGICSGALPATLRQGDFSRLLHPPPVERGLQLRGAACMLPCPWRHPSTHSRMWALTPRCLAFTCSVAYATRCRHHHCSSCDFPEAGIMHSMRPGRAHGPAVAGWAAALLRSRKTYLTDAALILLKKVQRGKTTSSAEVKVEKLEVAREALLLDQKGVSGYLARASLCVGTRKCSLGNGFCQCSSQYAEYSAREKTVL